MSGTLCVCFLAALGSSLGGAAIPPDTTRAGIVVEIGRMSGSGPDVFGQIEALELGPDGRIYILDGLSFELRIFDANGAPLRTVGRRGEGPGEFLSPVGMTWSPAGNLWVIDPENQRASVFDVEGDLVDTRHLPAGFSLAPWPGRFDDRGFFYSYLEGEGDSFDYRMIRYDSELTPTDTLTPPVPPEPPAYFEGRTARGSSLRARIPYSPRMVWRIDGQGRFVRSWTGEGRVYPGSGDDPIEIAAQPVPVTATERTAALEGLSRFVEMGGRVERSRIPAIKPPLAGIHLDDRDRIWIERTRGAGRDSTVFEVFTASGEFVDTVVVPVSVASVPWPVLRGDRMIAVHRDDLGVQRVVVLDLSPP